MKRWVQILLVVILGLPWFSVHASNFSTSMNTSTSLSVGQSFVLQVRVSDIKNLYTFEGDFEYDRTKLQVTSSSISTGTFEGDVGTRLVVEYLAVQSGNFLIAEISMKATENFKPGESTTIRLSGVSGSDGEKDISGSGSSITLTMSAAKSSNANLASISIDGTPVSNFSSSSTIVDLGTTEKSSLSLTATPMDSKARVSGTGVVTVGFGKQSFAITVSAEDGTVKTYTIRVERVDPRSNNNFLRLVQLSAGELEFSKEVLTYNVIVDHGVQFLRIVSIPEDDKATVVRDATYPLSIYDNQIRIAVTAENGERRIYTFNVSRKDDQGNIGDLSTINNLSSLIVDGYAIDFVSSKLDYALTVANHVTSLLVLALAEDDLASVNIEGHTQLRVGENQLLITVTSQSGESKVYKINVLRESDLPILTMDNLLDYLENTTVPIVNVQLEDQYVLSKEMIQAIRQSGKTVYFFKSLGGKTLFGWYLDGRAMLAMESLDLYVELHPSNKQDIFEAANFANLAFAYPRYQAQFPANTRLQVNVSDVFVQSTALHVYHFTNGAFELMRSDVMVMGGMIEFDLLSNEGLIISDQMLAKEKKNPWIIPVLITEVVVIVLLGVYLVISKRNKKRRYQVS